MLYMTLDNPSLWIDVECVVNGNGLQTTSLHTAIPLGECEKIPASQNFKWVFCRLAEWPTQIWAETFRLDYEKLWASTRLLTQSLEAATEEMEQA